MSLIVRIVLFVVLLTGCESVKVVPKRDMCASVFMALVLLDRGASEAELVERMPAVCADRMKRDAKMSLTQI